jgi:hypothetical protein
MPFDQPTRNRLQAFVAAARTLLTADFTRRLQQDYGLDPASGTVTDLDRLGHLDDARLATARLLREILAHYLANHAGGNGNARQQVLQRIAREQAFTALNRLAALRMLETRGLLRESVGHCNDAVGFQSQGFQLYQRLAGHALGETGDAFRVFLLSLFDELALDLGVLFDPDAPQGRLLPGEATLLKLLTLINDPEIEPLWAEDETIGWIYQYFNAPEERREMRDAGRSGPRNSRELAVRNQFFTPRYVVEFLVDNSLGRLWLEQTGGRTALRERCRLLALRPDEDLPAPDGSVRDPRDIRLLDPACGSMHFGLYAFDLFEIIYREAWDLPGIGDALARAYGWSDTAEHVPVPESVQLRRQPTVRSFKLAADLPVAEAVVVLARYGPDAIAGRPLIYHRSEADAQRATNPDTLSLSVPLADFDYAAALRERWFSPDTGAMFLDLAGCFDYATRAPLSRDEARERFECDIPRLIIEHNLHGVDIDPRAAQIAALALWLRAQRAWHAAGVPAADRPLIHRGHVVAAVAPPAAPEQRQAFAAGLMDLDADLFDATLKLLEHLPELGVLQRLEQALPALVQEIYGQHGPMFAAADMAQWDKAEQRLRAALERWLHALGTSYRGRLFAQDALAGLRLLDLTRERFDIVVMNPPFGALSVNVKAQLGRAYPRSKHDLLAIFVERGLELLRPGGRLGAITSRTGFFLSSYRRWREEIVLGIAAPEVMADLGHGVMDDAMVEAAAYVLRKRDDARAQ